MSNPTNPIVTIKLSKAHSIKGAKADKGTTHEIHKRVADDLVKREIATIENAKPAAK